MPQRPTPPRNPEDAPGDENEEGPAAMRRPPPTVSTADATCWSWRTTRRSIELVGAYARIAGFEYRAALDGATALAEVRRLPPTVIVLDLMLPDFDGFEICRRIKGELGRSDIPVIILTALDNNACRRQGFECGASEYLTKPFDPDRLIDTISRYAG